MIGAVVAIVTGVVVLLGDRGDGKSATTPIDDWDVVVVVSPAGEVSVLDRSGNPLDDAEGLSVGFRPSVVIPGPSSLVIGNARRAAYVDLGEWTVEDLAVGDDSSLALVPTSAATVVAAPPRGGNVLLLQQATGDVLDVAEFAGLADPLLLPGSLRAGSGRFLVADAQNFQTLMVGGDLEEPVYFPGRPLAIDGDLVVTGQPIGQRVDIGLFDLDGARLASTTAERLIGGTVDDGSFVFVTADGSIARFGPDDEESEVLGRLNVPANTELATAVSALAGTRLVVGNDAFTSVLDTAGTELARFAGTGFDAPVITTSVQRCVVIGPRASDTGDLRIVDLETGDEIGTVAGGSEPVPTPDGCTVAATGPAGQLVAGRDIEDTLGPDVSAVDAVAPDGQWVIATTTGGTRELRRIDGDADPVELPAAGTAVFVDRS